MRKKQEYILNIRQNQGFKIGKINARISAPNHYTNDENAHTKQAVNGD